MNFFRLNLWVLGVIAISSSLVMAVELESTDAPVLQESSLPQDESQEMTIRLNTESENEASCFSEASIEDSSAVKICSVNHSRPVVVEGEE
jgi:hypothetical protein